MISISYILLCGQILLLLTVILLQCLDGTHSQNSSTEEPSVPSTGQGSTTVPFTDLPTEEVPYDPAGDSSNYTQLYEYRPPSPVVLCSYL